MTKKEINPAEYIVDFKFKTKKKMIGGKKEFYFSIKVEDKMKKKITEYNQECRELNPEKYQWQEDFYRMEKRTPRSRREKTYYEPEVFEDTKSVQQDQQMNVEDIYNFQLKTNINRFEIEEDLDDCYEQENKNLYPRRQVQIFVYDD